MPRWVAGLAGPMLVPFRSRNEDVYTAMIVNVPYPGQLDEFRRIAGVGGDSMLFEGMAENACETAYRGLCDNGLLILLCDPQAFRRARTDAQQAGFECVSGDRAIWIRYPSLPWTPLLLPRPTERLVSAWRCLR